MYQEKGYLVLPKFFGAELDVLLEEYRQLANHLTSSCWTSAHDEQLKNWLSIFPKDLALIYDECKKLPMVERLAAKLQPEAEKLGYSEALPKKPFRIDLPKDTKELAHWHQDRHYLEKEGYQGDALVAWVPLQDVNWQNGCLSVMPKCKQ